MTKTEIEQKLIIDITRIMIESGDLTGPWDSCVANICTKLKSDTGSKTLLEKLRSLQAMPTKFTPQYIKGAIRILEIRIDNQDYSLPAVSATPKDITDEEDVITQLKTSGSTVIKYSDYEHADHSLQSIANKIKLHSGIDTKVELEPVVPGNYREKGRYIKKSIWLIYPNLPIITARKR